MTEPELKESIPQKNDLFKVGDANGASKLGRKKMKMQDTFFVGGLHKDDFERVCDQYEEIGYFLVIFMLDYDGYHWTAIYAKADPDEKKFT